MIVKLIILINYIIKLMQKYTDKVNSIFKGGSGNNYNGGRKKLTHFLNFPINDKKFIETFYAFTDEVKKINYWIDNSFHIAEILQFSTNLHFTLCVMNLQSNDDITKLNDIILKLQPKIKEILENKTLVLTPDKFDNFGNQNNAKVIFLKMKEDESYKKLIKIIEDTMAELLKEKLLDPADSKINLHMTIFNTTFMNSKKGFAAKDIYETINKFVFPPFEVNELRLSKMGLNKKTELYDTIYSYSLL